MLRFFRDFIAEAPDEVGIMANLRLAPPLPVFPEELQGTTDRGAHRLLRRDPSSEGREVLRPLREFMTPAARRRWSQAVCGPPGHVRPGLPARPPLLLEGLEAAAPHRRAQSTSSSSRPAAITSPLSAIPIFTLGGAVARAEDDATAFSGRGAAHDINFVASWLPDDPEPERHKAWARTAWEAIRPFSRWCIRQLPLRRTINSGAGRVRRRQVRQADFAEE